MVKFSQNPGKMTNPISFLNIPEDDFGFVALIGSSPELSYKPELSGGGRPQPPSTGAGELAELVSL